MEKVKTLKRETEKKKINLTKLKLNSKDEIMNNIKKTVSFIGKDLNNKNTTFEEIKKKFEFNNFKHELIDCSGEPIAREILRKFNKKSIPNAKVIRVELEGERYPIYTIMNVKIPVSRTTKKYYFVGTAKYFQILDFESIYGTLSLIDAVYNEVNDNGFYFSEDFNSVRIFNKTNSKKLFTKDDLEALLKIPTETLFSFDNRTCISKNFSMSELSAVILDILIVRKNMDFNIEIMSDYNKNSSSECARAFETKKNIPEKVMSLMKNSMFLEDFKYVEIDDETDLMKFKKVEREWQLLKKAINFNKFIGENKAELRFKKLGKHRAAGIYFPSKNCICVDIRSPKSFIHEFAHFIDYTYESTQLSMSFNFYKIIKTYKDLFNLALNELDDNNLKRKTSYFFAPTEIFARTFEIYLQNKGLISSFSKVTDEMTLMAGYPERTDEFIFIINNYFDQLVDVNLDVLEERPIIEKKAKYIQPIELSSGQFTFNI